MRFVRSFGFTFVLAVVLAIAVATGIASANTEYKADETDEVQRTATITQEFDSISPVQPPPSRAHVLLQLETESDYVVVGTNVTIKVRAVNVGTTDAMDVKIAVPNWPTDTFDLVSGISSASIPQISAGEEYTFDFQVLPNSAGLLTPEQTKGMVEYQYGSSVDSPIHKTGFGFTLGKVQVLTSAEYAAATASLWHELIGFWVLSCPTWVLPLCMWIRMSSPNINNRITRTVGRKKSK